MRGFTVLFWKGGRGHKKRVLCSVYAFDNVDNYVRPLKAPRAMHKTNNNIKQNR